MKTKFTKRLIAYIIDVIFLSAIIMMISYFIPKNDNVTKIQDKIIILNETYLNNETNTSNYINKYSTLIRNLDKENIIFVGINFILFFVYFVIVPFYTKGQTFGKYIMKIKIDKEHKLSILSLLIRSCIINGIGYLILSIVFIFLIPKDIYFYAITILGFIQFLLVIISGFMIIYNKNKRGLQDVLSNTDVVETK